MNDNFSIQTSNFEYGLNPYFYNRIGLNGVNMKILAAIYDSNIVVNGSSVIIKRGQRVKPCFHGNTWIETWGACHPWEGYPLNYPYEGYPLNYPYL